MASSKKLLYICADKSTLLPLSHASTTPCLYAVSRRRRELRRRSASPSATASERRKGFPIGDVIQSDRVADDKESLLRPRARDDAATTRCDTGLQNNVCSLTCETGRRYTSLPYVSRVRKRREVSGDVPLRLLKEEAEPMMWMGLTRRFRQSVSQPTRCTERERKGGKAGTHRIHLPYECHTPPCVRTHRDVSHAVEK